MKKHNVYLANELTGDIRLFNPKKIAQHVVENKLIKEKTERKHLPMVGTQTVF